MILCQRHVLKSCTCGCWFWVGCPEAQFASVYACHPALTSARNSLTLPVLVFYCSYTTYWTLSGLKHNLKKFLFVLQVCRSEVKYESYQVKIKMSDNPFFVHSVCKIQFFVLVGPRSPFVVVVACKLRSFSSFYRELHLGLWSLSSILKASNSKLNPSHLHLSDPCSLTASFLLTRD